MRFLHTQSSLHINIIYSAPIYMRVCNSIERIIWYNNIWVEEVRLVADGCRVSERLETVFEFWYYIYIYYTPCSLQQKVEIRTRIIRDPAALESRRVSSKFHVKKSCRSNTMNRVDDIISIYRCESQSRPLVVYF